VIDFDPKEQLVDGKQTVLVQHSIFTDFPSARQARVQGS
jgi:hypothetical protein